MMKTVSVAAALFLALTGSAFAQNIGGTYTVAGTTGNGAAYRGQARIELTSDTTCRITWRTGENEVSEGICMRNRNAFSAAYRYQNLVGLVIYQVMPDGTLNGIWTIAGQPGSGTEVLTPAR
jgi:hypothetical protein